MINLVRCKKHSLIADATNVLRHTVQYTLHTHSHTQSRQLVKRPLGHLIRARSSWMKIFRGRPCSWWYGMGHGIPLGRRRRWRRWVINGCEIWQASKNGRMLHAAHCSSSNSRSNSSSRSVFGLVFAAFSDESLYRALHKQQSRKRSQRQSHSQNPSSGNGTTPKGSAH